MSTGWLVFVLGLILGLGFGGTIGGIWGYRTGHLDGYQDHRAEVAELRNEADARRAPGAELEPIRAKTAPVSPWYQGMNAAAFRPRAVPGGGRPFPRASSRTATTAADIGPVFVPATGATRIPIRPQPGRDSGPGTETLDRLRTTGEMRAITENTETIIRGIIEGTWPPGKETAHNG